MSNSEYLAACLPALLKLPSDQVKEPSVPIACFIQETESLRQWSQDDISKLAAAGLDMERLDQLVIRSGACQEAQLLWIKAPHPTGRWQKQAPQAFDLFNEMHYAFRYAFQNNDFLRNRLAKISTDFDSHNLIQGLEQLALLGGNNRALLQTIAFDTSLLDQARSISSQLKEILALENGTNLPENDNKDLRDRAYTYLKILVDEVKNCGRYVFRKNKHRQQGYNYPNCSSLNFIKRNNLLQKSNQN